MAEHTHIDHDVIFAMLVANTGTGYGGILPERKGLSVVRYVYVESMCHIARECHIHMSQPTVFRIRLIVRIPED